jgi:DNA-binding response OmpR family regulator
MPKTILAIDDDRDMVDLIESFLQAEDYKILKSTRGAEGLRLATEQKPDLVLLDIKMPDINGFEVLQQIKERGIPTRVIMVTGVYFSLEHVISFIKAGACDYILKPLTADKLLNAVSRSLELETTINLRMVRDTTPIINELIVRAERLEKAKESLIAQNESLKREIHRLANKNQWINLATRLVFLLVATLITVSFHQLRILTNTQSLFFLPIAIFVLLLFPIEKVKSFYAKYRETEARVEIDSIKE